MADLTAEIGRLKGILKFHDINALIEYIEENPKHVSADLKTAMSTLQATTAQHAIQSNSRLSLLSEAVKSLSLDDSRVSSLLSNDIDQIRPSLDSALKRITEPDTKKLESFSHRLVAGALQLNPSGNPVNTSLIRMGMGVAMGREEFEQFKHYFEKRLEEIKQETGEDLSKKERLERNDILRIANVTPDQLTPDLIQKANTTLATSSLINLSQPLSQANPEFAKVRDALYKDIAKDFPTEPLGNVYVLNTPKAIENAALVSNPETANRLGSMAFRLGGNTYISSGLFDGTLPAPTEGEFRFILGHEVGHDVGPAAGVKGKDGEYGADDMGIRYAGRDNAKSAITKYMAGSPDTDTHPAGDKRFKHADTDLTDAQAQGHNCPPHPHSHSSPHPFVRR